MKKSLLSLTLIVFTANIGFGQFDFAAKMKISDTENNPSTVIVGDVNNDNFDDILVATRASANTLELYLNNGGTTLGFTKTLITNTLNDIFGATFVDLNGDGFLDLVATGATNGRVAWYLNNQAGAFITENVITSDLLGPTAVVSGDIDNDNDADLVIAEFGGGRTVWFSNDGTGTFSGPNTVATLANSGPIDLDVADFNEDGDLDVVVAYFTLGTVEIYENNLIPGGSVSFTKYTNSVATGYTAVFDVKFFDVNDDDDLDILASDFGQTTPSINGKLGLYVKADNSIATTFNETILTDSGAQNRITNAVSFDFDDDGFNDVVYVNAGGAGDVGGRISTDSGGLNPIMSIDNSQVSAFGLAVGDFDNNGSIDFVTTDDNPDDLNIFINSVVLGIEDYAISGIKIYPNPTTTKLTFEGMENRENSISIFNNVGQKLIETEIDNNNQVDVSSFAKGLYLLKFKDVDGVFKFIKN